MWELGLTSKADYERTLEASRVAKDYIYASEAGKELRAAREFYRNYSRYPLFRQQVRVQLAEAFPIPPPEVKQLDLFNEVPTSD